MRHWSASLVEPSAQGESRIGAKSGKVGETTLSKCPYNSYSAIRHLGSFNKIFLLKFDNGRQAALRIPNPIVPDVRRTTASEVATMAYVRDRWGDDTDTNAPPLPPKVLAWDASPDSEVGTPYILADFVEGTNVREIWFQPQTPSEAVGNVIFRTAWCEHFLLSDLFAFHGSLYFASDVDEADAARPLYSDQSFADENRMIANKYRIGPSAQRDWSRDVYGQVPVYKGPCERVSFFATPFNDLNAK